jgi:hypothetical protein
MAGALMPFNECNAANASISPQMIESKAGFKRSLCAGILQRDEFLAVSFPTQGRN